MNDLVGYLIESSLILAILYFLYWFLFSKSTFFKLNRFYLLSMILCSFIIPFIHFNPADVPLTVYTFEFDPVIVTQPATGNSQPMQPLEIRIIFILYFSGAILFGLRFLAQLARLLLLVKRFEIVNQNGIKVVIVDKNCSPSSFFNIVFLPGTKEQEEILTHELVHARQGHSFDIIAIELLTIVQWFNPFVWLCRSSLKNVHEFLADEGVLLKGFNRSAYQNLMLFNAFGIRLSELAENFSYSPIKKRIKMMTKNKSGKFSLLKYMFTVPIFAGTILYFGCNNNEDVKESLTNATEDPVSFSRESAVESPVLQDTIEEEAFIKVEKMPKFQGSSEEDGFREWISQNLKYPEEAVKNYISGKVFVQFAINSKGKVTDAKVTRGANPLLNEEALRVIKSSPDWEPGYQRERPVKVQFTFPVVFELKEEVFTVVEVMPKFQGQDFNAFRQWINQNLKYPEEAAKNNISGKVYVQFSISSAGKVTDTKIVRSVDPLLDQEALRVVKSSPDWTPGMNKDKPVKVQFTFAIVFVLSK